MRSILRPEATGIIVIRVRISPVVSRVDCIPPRPHERGAVFLSENQ